MGNRIIPFVALTLALAACRAAPAISPAPAPTGIPSAAPAPTLAPSPTLEPSSTAEPSSTVEASPTEPPTPTLAPTTEPTATAIAGLCYNPFYPVTATARWQYLVVAGTNAPITYSKTVTNLTDQTFTEHRVFDNAPVDEHWTCSSAGLASNEFGNLHIHGQTQYNFTTTRSAGPTILPPDRWTVGTKWSNSYDISGQMVQNGINMSGTGTVDLDNTIAAQEQVTVPAGTFQVFRIDSTITLHLNASTALGSLPFTVNLQQSSWYARDVGLVKSTLTMNQQAATTELVSYTP